jgi:hypothetical protein
MKILFLTTLPAIEASTRYRVLQYFPILRNAGHEPHYLRSSWSPLVEGRRASRVVC